MALWLLPIVTASAAWLLARYIGRIERHVDTHGEKIQKLQETVAGLSAGLGLRRATDPKP
jgi:hypothetical protein